MKRARLYKKYLEEVIPNLMTELGYKNKMQVPRLEKIVVNACLSEAVQDNKILTKYQEDISQITGQRAVITRAKKAIANFKLRKGIPIGIRVTLRHNRMYEFFDRLVNVALPRVRDFKGVSFKAFDGQGNYSLGITEHVIFPEIDPNKADKVRGFNINMITSAKSDGESRSLLAKLGMPFRK